MNQLNILMIELENLLTSEEIIKLINYQQIVDHRSDVRPDVISKHPRWNIDDWPQYIVKKILDTVLDYQYEVDEVIFNHFKISFKVHVDSGNSEKQRRGHGIIIPLYTLGEASTVFFDNFWNQESCKFSRKENSPFAYQLLNIDNEFQVVADIRELYQQCISNPSSITDFAINDQFLKDLEYLIEARSNKKIGKVDNRINDYSKIINYKENEKFDETLRLKYLQHVDLEDLHGLTFSKLILWNPGNVIVFDRNRLHAASSTHREKCGITIFTNQN